MSERPIDVVLLHHGEEDKATALMDQLRKEGVESRPISELDADEDWPKQLEEALNATSVCAVLLGNDERLADPARQAVERRAARARDFQVVVVLLPETRRSPSSGTNQTERQAPAQTSAAGQAPPNDQVTKSRRGREKR
jgi:histidyl-tRNA synthetase